MTSGVGVLGIDSLGQGADGAHKGVLQVFIDAGVINSDSGFIDRRDEQIDFVFVQVPGVSEIDADDTDGLTLGLQWQSDLGGISLDTGDMLPETIIRI